MLDWIIQRSAQILNELEKEEEIKDSIKRNQYKELQILSSILKLALIISLNWTLFSMVYCYQSHQRRMHDS